MRSRADRVFVFSVLACAVLAIFLCGWLTPGTTKSAQEWVIRHYYLVTRQPRIIGPIYGPVAIEVDPDVAEKLTFFGWPTQYNGAMRGQVKAMPAKDCEGVDAILYDSKGRFVARVKVQFHDEVQYLVATIPYREGYAKARLVWRSTPTTD
jgi:hypothetical protein